MHIQIDEQYSMLKLKYRKYIQKYIQTIIRYRNVDNIYYAYVILLTSCLYIVLQKLHICYIKQVKQLPLFPLQSPKMLRERKLSKQVSRNARILHDALYNLYCVSINKKPSCC